MASQRQYKLNKALTDKMAGLARAGAFTDTLCAMVGINRQSYYKWLKAGKAIVDRCEANDQPLPTDGRDFELAYFYQQMTSANAESEYGLSTKLWDAAMAGDTKAIMWILERKYPHKWGRMSDRVIAEESMRKWLDSGQLIHIIASPKQE